jgi:putative ABC transport system ATP-binding protein
MVVVTHNQVIARLADRVLWLHGGSISGDESVSMPVGAEAFEW